MESIISPEEPSSDGVPFIRSLTSDDFLSGFMAYSQVYDDWLRDQPNDFNLITSMLKANDEVRLHSRVIFSWLNPQGSHRQGNAFAREFMVMLGSDLASWLDLSRLKVFREKNRIDLCLTDGRRYLIIENKLDAPDQRGQVRRYVEFVQTEREALPEDILLIFLTKGSRNPSKRSLAEWAIEPDGNGRLRLVDENGKEQAGYRHCSYGTDVLEWLERCELQLSCSNDGGRLDNLRFAFGEYRRVVERISGKTKDTRMALEAWILEGGDPASMHKRIACAESIVEQMWKLKARWLKHAMTEGMDALLARWAEYVEPVKPEDLGVTTVEEFKSPHATAFFSPKTRWHPNKGRFWKVTKGAHADRLALVICIGKTWLHVGLLPLRAGKLSDGVWIENLDARALNIRKNPISEKVLLGFRSFGVPLEQAILQMAPFECSEQGQVVQSIVSMLVNESTNGNSQRLGLHR